MGEDRPSDAPPNQCELVYAQCWEDPHVLERALRIEPGAHVLSICGAGDNAFALLAQGAASVTCVDRAVPELAIAEYKRTAARALPIDSFRSALGLEAAGRRVWFYHHVRPSLSLRARGFLDQNEDLIRNGLLRAGQFERGLQWFRRIGMPWVKPARPLEQLLALSDAAEQRRWYTSHWNHRRWRWLLRSAFAPQVLARRRGTSAAKFRDVPSTVHARTVRAFCELPLKTNFFMQWYLTGQYPNLEAGPPYLSSEGHRLLGERGHRVRFVEGDILSFLRGCADNSFDAFNLSNVFEYVDQDVMSAILAEVARVGRRGARVCYWNLFLDRHRPAHLSDRLHRDVSLAEELSRRDRAVVYRSVQVEEVY